MKLPNLSTAAVLLMLTNILLAVPVAAQDTEPSGHLLIVALQSYAANKKFIKIHNPTAKSMDIAGWKLQYRGAARQPEDGGGWITKAAFECVAVKDDCQVLMEPGATFIAANYQLADSGANVFILKEKALASEGGQVRLVRGDGGVEDMVGYGTAKTFEGDAGAPALKADRHLERKIDDNDKFIDTNHNADDFVLSVPSGVSATEERDEVEDVDMPATGARAEVRLTELLPDPVAPEQDSEDEFVELYNPTTETVDLTGFVLQAGANWRYSFELDGLSIGPGGYLELRSADTHLTLGNVGTTVRLVGPAGEVIDETHYDTAKAGQAWARTGVSGWEWTAVPTPGLANQFVAPPVKAIVSAPKKASTIKKAVAKAASKKAAAKPKNAVKAATDIAPLGGANQAASQNSSFNYLLLGGLAAIVGGYVAYEYRHEMLRGARWLRGTLKIGGRKQ